MDNSIVSLILRDVKERFWSKVNKQGPVPRHCSELGPCWVWTAGKDGHGYGAFHITHRHQRQAHRVSWEFANGPVVAHDSYHGFCVCHRCDNPECVNPSHLFLGTASENNMDRDTKGRAATGPQGHRIAKPGGRLIGVSNHNAKLNPDAVREIRLLLDQGLRKSHVAKRFNVSTPTIASIESRKTWWHVA